LTFKSLKKPEPEGCNPSQKIQARPTSKIERYSISLKLSEGLTWQKASSRNLAQSSDLQGRPNVDQVDAVVSQTLSKPHSHECVLSRPGSGSGPSPNFRLGLSLNKPKARARMGLGLGVGPRARAHIVKARARLEPEVFWPDPVLVLSDLRRSKILIYLS
jgi:hypothetical protein